MGNVEETTRTSRQTSTPVAPSKEPKNTEARRDKTDETATRLWDRASETRDQVRERAQEVGGQAKELGNEAMEVASAYYEQGREKLREWEGTLETQLREKPLQSLLIAGGVGLLLGLLWRRR